ncbi:hypothetical protein BCR34DRAFT_212456 [Clohesyomyces aquaticus]|uniref:Uncharacterized protein n=1 Tax=Clohesyomyces aquaticus TaxID=1231657 RepID=A0A1Y1ZXJ6_9PLEO|nr:hypothetical protein BCR34DRAFT_212456 [Clohesyomyces aquaticus]
MNLRVAPIITIVLIDYPSQTGTSEPFTILQFSFELHSGPIADHTKDVDTCRSSRAADPKCHIHSETSKPLIPRFPEKSRCHQTPSIDHGKQNFASSSPRHAVMTKLYSMLRLKGKPECRYSISLFIFRLIFAPTSLTVVLVPYLGILANQI